MTPESLGHDLTARDPEQQYGGYPVEQVAADRRRVLWYEEPDALSLMARFMARAGYSSGDVAYMISKPWKYADEYAEALAWAERTQRGFAAIDVGGAT